MAVQETCPECGFRGFADLRHDRREHLILHDEFLAGVKLRQLGQFESVAKIGSDDILLIRPTSSRFARIRTERLSRRSIREPTREGGYDKPTFWAENRYQIVPEFHTHALVLARGSRGIGLLVIERRERDSRYLWVPSENRYSLQSDSSSGPHWSLIHIWLLPQARGHGLAGRLIDLASEGFKFSPDEAGWLTPLSARGFRLVRRFAPSGFWAAGYLPTQPDPFPIPFG